MGERSREHAADFVLGAESGDVCMVINGQGVVCWTDGQSEYRIIG
jgi:hypothetical protein